jgi:hypothetical protein
VLTGLQISLYLITSRGNKAAAKNQKVSIMSYLISDNCPEAIIFQSLESGYFDYSESGTEEAAWEDEKAQSWVKDSVAEGKSLAECKAEFLNSLTTATKLETLEAANNGYAWPLNLGFVVEIN